MIDTSIKDNIEHVQEQITSACMRANRNPNDVTLVAVSKTHSVEAIVSAMDVGLSHFGENRVEETLDKIPKISEVTNEQVVWHYIGHIQSRQAKDIVPLVDVIHSIDRLKIARKISSLAKESDKTIEGFIEINISGETAKYGFEASNWKQNERVKSELWQNLETIISLPNLKIRGLMTMAPFYDKMEETRPIFASLAELRDEIKQDFAIELSDLSMGMTNDFPIAIEEGATIVRIGRAIFGNRN